jgi:HK97 gp10 family phage protein
MAARVKVEGVRQLRVTVGNLVAALGDEERSKFGKIAADTMADASKLLRDAIRAKAIGQNWKKESVEAIFWYGEQKRQYSAVSGRETGYSRRIRANLVGIRKGAPPRSDPKIYAEWVASPNNKSAKRKRAGGEIIGQSFASMFEFGTSKMLPRPAFRPAYQQMKSTIRRMIIEGYKRIIKEANELA